MNLHLRKLLDYVEIKRLQWKHWRLVHQQILAYERTCEVLIFDFYWFMDSQKACLKWADVELQALPEAVKLDLVIFKFQ
jgi:hypothetical protein